MLFNAAAATFAGLLAIVPQALATITITGPSANSYWVQNTSNTITWEFNQGDPNPISITVTNPNTTFLNGAFSIAESVDLSNKTFTVTNVTLVVHTGYVVNFVNITNSSQIYASSAPFELKPGGTPQAPQATSAGSSPSATSTSPGNSSSSGSTTSNGTSGSPTSSSGAAPRLFDGTFNSVASMLGMSVVMAVAGALVTI